MPRRSFLTEQIATLQLLDLVAFITELPDGIGYVEAHRSEGGDCYRVVVEGEPAVPAAAKEAITRLGLAAHDGGGARDNLTGDAAAELVDRLLTEAFGCGAGAPLDIHHASRRAEIDAERRLATLRDRLSEVLAQRLDPVPSRSTTMATSRFPIWVSGCSSPPGRSTLGPQRYAS